MPRLVSRSASYWAPMNGSPMLFRCSPSSMPFPNNGSLLQLFKQNTMRKMTRNRIALWMAIVLLGNAGPLFAQIQPAGNPILDAPALSQAIANLNAHKADTPAMQAVLKIINANSAVSYKTYADMFVRVGFIRNGGIGIYDFQYCLHSGCIGLVCIEIGDSLGQGRSIEYRIACRLDLGKQRASISQQDDGHP